MILVDTSAWSLLLRRAHPSVSPVAQALSRFIMDDEPLYLSGVIYQEVLQGIRLKRQADAIKGYLSEFPFLEATREVHALAAEFFNRCRAKGVTAHTVDCLIAATASRHRARLLTADGDFALMARHCEFELLSLKDTS